MAKSTKRAREVQPKKEVEKKTKEKKVAKKKTKKKAVKKAEKVKEEKKVEVDKSYLTPHEMLYLERLDANTVIAQKDMGLEEQNLANLRLEMKVLSNKIEKQQVVVSKRQLEYNSAIDAYNNAMINVMKSHNLNPGEINGYNKQTGKIATREEIKKEEQKSQQ